MGKATQREMLWQEKSIKKNRKTSEFNYTGLKCEKYWELFLHSFS